MSVLRARKRWYVVSQVLSQRGSTRLIVPNTHRLSDDHYGANLQLERDHFNWNRLGPRPLNNYSLCESNYLWVRGSSHAPYRLHSTNKLLSLLFSPLRIVAVTPPIWPAKQQGLAHSLGSSKPTLRVSQPAVTNIGEEAGRAGSRDVTCDTNRRNRV